MRNLPRGAGGAQVACARGPGKLAACVPKSASKPGPEDPATGLRLHQRFARFPEIAIGNSRGWTKTMFRVYLAVLSKCDRWDRRTTATELGERTGIHPGNVRTALARLEREGMIRRYRGDRRANHGTAFQFAGLDFEHAWLRTRAASEPDACLETRARSSHACLGTRRTRAERRVPSSTQIPPDPSFHPEAHGMDGRFVAKLGEQWAEAGRGAYPDRIVARELDRLFEHAHKAGMDAPSRRELEAYLRHAALDESIHSDRAVDCSLMVACVEHRFVRWLKRDRKAEARRHAPPAAPYKAEPKPPELLEAMRRAAAGNFK